MSVCEEKIFKEVYSKWQLSLQKFLFSKGMQRGDVSDIIQESFMRLWKNCRNVNVEKVGSYLFSTASNIGIDLFRKQKVRLKYNIPSMGNTIEDGQYKMESNEFRKRIEAAIDSMNEKAKEVFILNRFDNMTYKQIAATLDISVKAVEKRMHNALAHMYSKKIFKKK